MTRKNYCGNLLWQSSLTLLALVATDGNVSAHYEYAPFGEPTARSCEPATANPWRFSSEYEDDMSKMVYYNYRHYSPECGKWVGRDPIMEEGGLNLYSFVENCPMTRTDFLGNIKGLDCCACAAALVGKFGGGLAGCAYGCYREKSSSYSWGDCLSDCLELQFSPEEIYDQFKENPAEWIGAVACLSCGVRAIRGYLRQTCSEVERVALQHAVEMACKLNGKSRCNPTQTLSELKANRAKLLACLAARVAINNRCFYGGNPGHRKNVRDLHNAVSRCTLLIIQSGGL